MTARGDQKLLIDKSFLLAALPLVLGYMCSVASLHAVSYVLIGVSLVMTMRIVDLRERNYALWLWLGITILALTPVGTEINLWHGIIMTIGMLSAVIVPYLLAHRRYRESFIHMGLDLRRKWSRRELGYVVFAIVLTGFWLSLYFLTTSAHDSWQLDSGLDILVTFTVIMIIGLWEEFFFIALVLTITKRFLSFMIANVMQATMFTGFLYQIGFVGWIVPLIFAYALYQGYVFHATRSLLVTITIHVGVDLIVFMALLYSARPDLFAAIY